MYDFRHGHAGTFRLLTRREGLAFLASNDFVVVADTFALIRFRLLARANFRSELADRSEEHTSELQSL